MRASRVVCGFTWAEATSLFQSLKSAVCSVASLLVSSDAEPASQGNMAVR